MKYAVAAVIKKDEAILLCRRSSGAVNQQGKWENVGGKIDGNETPEKAIVREIMEELECAFYS